ncbi:tRNA pseudouridine(55) synthase TruB [Actinomadura madurae]|uniref:tRNA pseudouridine(55) synthase TruB n=1 Tax=Actinomadura madurae TaxID=1993 RepID=UPI0020D24CD2|nr:tRNA pseudouridine(55) synthase TruB [Actinomadura madurae]MCP9954518.1 tRNA pseudouridine(55) synthase TruB [Actinomadura madurae]MCP9983748.1 tRNA pseudouridine(55) synthase TruB [Actinomadura madurae]MCQ0004688.1 tRNA pseudouridine(55) synthase TruB [Actinomadura madurae]
MENSGLVIVDKPAGWTSHDVVGRMRRLAKTRRVGHAGTLDPMATGVLVLGVGKATRLLGHLALTEKGYDATIRLGESTNTDDAEGETTATASAAGVTDEALRAGVAELTGPIRQIPPQVSAIKVNGQRAYKMARKGEEVELAARPVTVHAFTVLDVRRHGDLIDVDASIACSSGTYIRSLARDLGASLGCGGHLTALRRTRVGPYDLSTARTLERLAEKMEILPMDEAVAAVFPRRDVSDEDARKVAHGGRLPAAGLGPGPVGVFAPDGTLLALVEEQGRVAKPLAVFVP